MSTATVKVRTARGSNGARGRKTIVWVKTISKRTRRGQTTRTKPDLGELRSMIPRREDLQGRMPEGMIMTTRKPSQALRMTMVTEVVEVVETGVVAVIMTST